MEGTPKESLKACSLSCCVYDADICNLTDCAFSYYRPEKIMLERISELVQNDNLIGLVSQDINRAKLIVDTLKEAYFQKDLIKFDASLQNLTG